MLLSVIDDIVLLTSALHVLKTGTTLSTVSRKTALQYLTQNGLTNQTV
jgi:hypothetical protein